MSLGEKFYQEKNYSVYRGENSICWWVSTIEKHDDGPNIYLSFVVWYRWQLVIIMELKNYKGIFKYRIVSVDGDTGKYSYC